MWAKREKTESQVTQKGGGGKDNEDQRRSADQERGVMREKGRGSEGLVQRDEYRSDVDEFTVRVSVAPNMGAGPAQDEDEQ